MSKAPQNIPRAALQLAAAAIGLTMVTLPHPAHGKLPPPTPTEQAVAAWQTEIGRTQKTQEQAQLTTAQDHPVARSDKGGNNASDAITPVANLSKDVAEASGTVSPHGDSWPSAESHSGNAC